MVVPMQKAQCIERGRKHFTHLLGGQRAPRKDFGESLIRVLHHDEYKRSRPQMTSSGVQQPDEVRMGERGGYSPLHQSCISLRKVGRYQLDGSIDDLVRVVFGEEDGAM